VEALYQKGTWARSYLVLDVTPVNEEGEAMARLGEGSFTARVTVQKGEAEETATVILAVYDENGRMLEVYLLDAADAEGDTFVLEQAVSNRNGRAAVLRAFLVSSLSDPVPVGTEFVWPGH
jgi:hypothetical protein